MNEFSKEELENMVHIINDVHNGSQAHGLERDFDLRDKIQSMIDNYCEHEPNIMSQDERERKFKIYKEQVLPAYGNNPDNVPPHLEPDFNEGWE